MSSGGHSSPVRVSFPAKSPPATEKEKTYRCSHCKRIKRDQDTQCPSCGSTSYELI